MSFSVFRSASKNIKPAKKSESRSTVEKSTKPEPKKPSTDLPAVQCKDTLLLDYDHNKQYSKRGVVSNWDKYAELPDDDDDNCQLSAADFAQLLSASKSIGDHFTFASERSWLQNDGTNLSDEGSMSLDLFKLNILNLKNGIGQLPFYFRQGLSKEIFTEDEITSMDRQSSKKPLAGSETQKLLDILTLGDVITKQKTNTQTPLEKDVDFGLKNVAVESTPKGVDLESSLRNTYIDGELTKPKSTPTPNTSSSKVPSNGPSTVKSSKTENIQDWLDDILNED